jgi:hypothetical protein
VHHYTIKHPGTSLHRLKLSSKRLKVGNYRVTLSAKLGARTQRLTLWTHRL